MATKLDQDQTSSLPIVGGLRFKSSRMKRGAKKDLFPRRSIYKDVQKLYRTPKLRGAGRLSLQKRSANSGFQV